jgi:apolipoprotein N-acyltransferase
MLFAGLASAVALQSGSVVQAPESNSDHAALLVQENLPILATEWTAQYFDQTIAELVTLSENPPRTAEAQRLSAQPKLIIWPESPAPFYTADPKFHHWMAALATDSGSYVIAGSLGIDAPSAANASEPTAQPILFNSATLVTPEGEFSARYDKIHLVPFGEYVPAQDLLAFAQKLTKDIGTFGRGRQRATLPVGEHKVGAFICYESIFPDEIRQFADAGAELFVNISNDGWFGESGAPGQHLNMVRMRAIENARWVVRATNTGITSSVDPYGRVVTRAARNIRAAVIAPYAFASSTTFYTRHGDWFAYACAIIAVLALLLALFPAKSPTT